jgi:hypothetical protein
MPLGLMHRGLNERLPLGAMFGFGDEMQDELHLLLVAGDADRRARRPALDPDLCLDRPRPRQGGARKRGEDLADLRMEWAEHRVGASLSALCPGLATLSARAERIRRGQERGSLACKSLFFLLLST